MEKMAADSLPALVRMVGMLDTSPASENRTRVSD
jgi:hypothetical protein